MWAVCVVSDRGLIRKLFGLSHMSGLGDLFMVLFGQSGRGKIQKIGRFRFREKRQADKWILAVHSWHAVSSEKQCQEADHQSTILLQEDEATCMQLQCDVNQSSIYWPPLPVMRCEASSALSD